MRLVFYLTFLFALFCRPVQCQETILYFSWNSSITVPDIGPDGLVATTDSPYASIVSGGVDGSNGLSAGLRPGGSPSVLQDKANLNLVVPATEAFNVDGIDISIDYQRDESSGNLVSRGAGFVFGTAAGAYVSYRLQDPVEGNITTFTSNATALNIDDNLFHTLRFVYDPNSGEAILSVDGSAVWQNGFNTPGQTLYWDESADLMIGTDIDGNGDARAILDNFSFGAILLQPLPVDLVAFTALANMEAVQLTWETAQEENHESFRVQRSSEAGKWTTLATVGGRGDRRSGAMYQFTDTDPLQGINYYRLALVDYSGNATFSPIRSARFLTPDPHRYALFPNPAVDLIQLNWADGPDQVRIIDIHGKDVSKAVEVVHHTSSGQHLDIRALLPGWYIIMSPGGPLPVFKR